MDEALQRDFTARRDRLEQIAHRGFAVTLDFLKLDRPVALLKREDIGRFLNPALLVEQLDLLLAEAFDVEGAARDEMS